MATATFFVPTAVLGQALFENADIVDVLSFGTTRISAGIPGGATLLILDGRFDVYEGQLTGGTINAVRTLLLDGSKELEVSGLQADLATLFGLLRDGDVEGVLGLVFAGSDAITGSSGADALAGYGGDDTIDGGAGVDTMDGGPGADTYHVRQTGDRVVETAPGAGGIDTVLVHVADYTLPTNVEHATVVGTAGARLVGNGLDNHLAGGVANDTLVGGAGNDWLDGGSGGRDAADYSTAPAGVQVNASMFTPQDTGAAGLDLLVSIESLIGSAFDDQLIGGDGGNRLVGGAGDDTLDGWLDADTLVGGNGSDTYHVRDATDVLSETNAGPAGGIDIVLSDMTSYTLGPNIGNARVMGAGGRLIGNARDNVLSGLYGDDDLRGGDGFDIADYSQFGFFPLRVSLATTAVQATGAGNDVLSGIEGLRGAAQGDRLTGNSGANLLAGVGGNDTLAGGAGPDTLRGGAGDDSFRFNAGLNGSTNVDMIGDFVAVDDRIVLENGVFTKFANPGALPAGTFRANASGTAVDANDHLVYETDTGKLSYDADGNGAGAAVQIALLAGAPSLTGADFWIT